MQQVRNSFRSMFIRNAIHQKQEVSRFTISGPDNSFVFFLLKCLQNPPAG